MDNQDYDIAIGKLMRLKYILRPKYHSVLDELIDMLVVDGHEKEKNYDQDN